MELDFAFLAAQADLTKENKLISFGIGFDAMLADSFPATVIPFFLVAKFNVVPDDLRTRHAFRIERVDPGGEIIAAAENEIEIRPNMLDKSLPNGSFVVTSIQMGIEKPGTYQFRIFLDDVLCKTIPLYLFVAPLPQEQSAG